MLGRMFDLSSPFSPARMLDGAHFIDANPDVFEVLVLRSIIDFYL